MKLYIDTSVLGGYFEQKFQIWNRKLVEKILDGEHTAIVSDIIPPEAGLNLKSHRIMCEI